jgi:hypothetical protein
VRSNNGIDATAEGGSGRGLKSRARALKQRRKRGERGGLPVQDDPALDLFRGRTHFLLHDVIRIAAQYQAIAAAAVTAASTSSTLCGFIRRPQA